MQQVNELTVNGKSGGLLARIETSGKDAASARLSLTPKSHIEAMKQSGEAQTAPKVKRSQKRRARRACKPKPTQDTLILDNPTVEDTPENVVNYLLHLLGSAVFIICQQRCKRPSAPWKYLTLDGQTPKRLEQLRHHAKGGGNLGVALGKVSQGLCAIDFDTEPEAAEFLACNPKLATSLRTRAERGYQIWVRILGTLPASVDLKHGADGRKVAEWRADGRQSIIHGIHPEGNPYQRMVDAPPVTLRFEEIAWPAGWIVPAHPSREATIQKQHIQRNFLCMVFAQ